MSLVLLLRVSTAPQLFASLRLFSGLPQRALASQQRNLVASSSPSFSSHRISGPGAAPPTVASSLAIVSVSPKISWRSVMFSTAFRSTSSCGASSRLDEAPVALVRQWGLASSAELGMRGPRRRAWLGHISRVFTWQTRCQHSRHEGTSMGRMNPMQAALVAVEAAGEDLLKDTSHTGLMLHPLLGRDGGGLEIFMGPMFAGKTSVLLERVQAYEATGLQAVVLKSDRDSRYSKDRVVTHDGRSRACYAVSSLETFREIVGEETYQSIDVIAIDEAQFFPDLLEFCVTAADHHQKKVIIAGLDGDYKRQRFGHILDLIPVADRVVKLTAKCRLCEEERLAAVTARAVTKGNDLKFGDALSPSKDCWSPALFSLRMTGEDGQELVGGAETYAPVCRRHYIEYMKGVHK